MDWSESESRGAKFEAMEYLDSTFMWRQVAILKLLQNHLIVLGSGE